MKLYLAGPLGFTEAGRYFQDQVLIPKIESAGLEVLNPWKLTDTRQIAAVASMPYGDAKREAWKGMNVIIGGNNRGAIDACDIVLAVLDGVDVDSGTAAEIGYGFAKGKVIIGYRGDFRIAADNEGSEVNLQVEYFIRESGGDIAKSVEETLGMLKVRL